MKVALTAEALGDLEQIGISRETIRPGRRALSMN